MSLKDLVIVFLFILSVFFFIISLKKTMINEVIGIMTANK